MHTWMRKVRVGRRRPEAVTVVSAQLLTSAPVMRDVSRTDMPWCPVAHHEDAILDSRRSLACMMQASQLISAS